MSTKMPFCPAFLLSAGILFYATACKKKEAVADSHCISRISIPFTQTTLSSDQLDSINQLFAGNGLSTGGLQFVYFTPAQPTNDTAHAQTSVTANLYINGLPFFGEQEVFSFHDGFLEASYLYPLRPADNDTSGHQTLTYLRSAFFSHVSEAIRSAGIPNSKPYVPVPDNYRDSCLQAQLGYLDVEFTPGNAVAGGANLVKVWKVTLLNEGYPTVYVRDDNGFGWGEPVFLP